MTRLEDILIYIETIEVVTGAHDWRGTHLCDYAVCTSTSGASSSVPLSDKKGKSNRLIPPEVIPLLHSAKAAVDELGCQLVIIDVSTLTFREKRRRKIKTDPIPRIEIANEVLLGTPTKDEIVEFYQSVCGFGSSTQSAVDGTRGLLGDTFHDK